MNTNYRIDKKLTILKAIRNLLASASAFASLIFLSSCSTPAANPPPQTARPTTSGISAMNDSKFIRNLVNAIGRGDAVACTQIVTKNPEEAKYWRSIMKKGISMGYFSKEELPAIKFIIEVIDIGIP